VAVEVALTDLTRQSGGETDTGDGDDALDPRRWEQPA